jgi:hypothetical protein
MAASLLLAIATLTRCSVTPYVRLPGVSDVEHQWQWGRARAYLPGMFTTLDCMW